MHNDLSKIIMVGDRVLIQPKKESETTKSGLFLPPGYQEKEMVQEGFVLLAGPGYPLPPEDSEEPWKQSHGESMRYIPLQARPGDLAVYLQKNAIEVMISNEKYFIVPQNAILLLHREE